MKAKEIEKNILDLRHSVDLAKAGTFLALAISSWIALFFSIQEFQQNIRFALTVATIVAFLFLTQSIKYFRRCEDIHIKLNDLK